MIIMHLFLRICLVFYLCVANFSAGFNSSQNSITMDFKTGASKIITLAKNHTIIINAECIPLSVSVLMFQAHSQIENITISNEPVATIHNSVTGVNIGMVVKLQNSESEKQVWLSNLSPKDVQVFIAVSSIDSFGPVPGGCNMEFPVEIAPYLRLRSDTMRLYVEYQHASFGFKRNVPHPKCILSAPYISYEIYVLFLKENDFGESEYFKNIEFMNNVSMIKEHSTKAASYSLHPDTRYSFFMYPNIGVVYNVVAKYTINNEVKESAYIPIVSYGCPSSEFTSYGCNLHYSVEGRLFLFALSIYGFIVAFFGHSIIGSVLLFFGLLSSYLIGFILIGRYLNFSKTETADLAMIVGIVGGMILLFLWMWLRHPLILLFLDGPVLGFLLTAIVFYTPVGNSEVFINEKNFWSLMGTGILFITVLTLIFPKLMTIMASSIVGSYVMLLFYDDFVGTRLSYIILNVIRRAVSKDVFAANDLPFQTNDIILTTIWIILSILALISWYKKPFSSILKRSNCGYSFVYGQSSQRDYPRQIHNVSGIDDMHQPILRQSNISYQTF